MSLSKSVFIRVHLWLEFSFPFARFPFQFRAMPSDYVLEPFHSGVHLQIDYVRGLLSVFAKPGLIA
jgi:hypothetical protein